MIIPPRTYLIANTSGIGDAALPQKFDPSAQAEFRSGAVAQVGRLAMFGMASAPNSMSGIERFGKVANRPKSRALRFPLRA